MHQKLVYVDASKRYGYHIIRVVHGVRRVRLTLNSEDAVSADAEISACEDLLQPIANCPVLEHDEAQDG